MDVWLINELLEHGISHKVWSSQAFVHRGAKILQLAGHHGKCVDVGRGAQYTVELIKSAYQD